MLEPYQQYNQREEKMSETTPVHTGIFVDTARVNLKLSMCFARPAGVKLTGAENEGFSCM